MKFFNVFFYVVFICILTGLSPLLFLVYAQSPTVIPVYEHIKQYDVHIVIREDGRMNISETIQYDFADQERHGIFRTIPFIKSNDKKEKFLLSIQNIQVVDEHNKPYPFKKSDVGESVQLKIGDPDNTITGVHTYKIEYTVSGALSYFTDHDELYWNAIGTEWNIPIQYATVFLEFPKDISTSLTSYDCFFGVKGSIDDRCKVTREPNSITFAVPLSLDSYHGMTIVTGFPKGIVAELHPQPVISFFETILGRIVLICFIIIIIFWYAVLPIIIVYRWFRFGRDPKPPMGETSAWFSPPTGKNKRPLTPAEAGALIDETVHTRDVFATIIDLSRRGFIKIKEKKKNELELHKLSGNESVLVSHEQELMSALFESNDVVHVQSLRLYTKIEKIKSTIYTMLVKEGFFLRNPQHVRNLYAILAGLSLMTMNPTLLITSWLFGTHMPKKTLEGAQASVIGKSLRNFLKSQEQKLNHQAKNQLFFEKLLPFAVAFGVEKEWAKRFANMPMKSPDWYESSTGASFNSVALVQSLDRGYTGSFLTSASPQQSSSTGFSSGFSGGSSGGGGGGGGGGSW